MARGQGKNIDYNELFIFYCTPTKDGRLVSYADVAKKFGLHLRKVEHLGQKHEWVKKRETIGKERVQKAKETILEEIEEASKRHLQNYIDIETLAMDDLKDQGKVFYGEKSNIKNRKYSPWALSEASAVAKRAMNGQRVILGLPTEVSKADINSTTRSLELPPDQIEEMDKFLERNGNKHPKSNK